MSLQVTPLTLRQANVLVTQWHRHHKASKGHRWSIGAKHSDVLVGAVIVGRPVARQTNQYTVAEVARCVTNGYRNACSKLYAAAARAAEAMGYEEIQTFILESESGTSLIAAGWTLDVDKDGNPRFTRGESWNRPSRNGRRDDQPQCPKKRYYKQFNKSTLGGKA